MKESIALPKEVIDERFNVRGRDGVDIEIVGGTGAVNGGAFVYTNLDTLAVGVVLKLPKLAAQQRRPEEIIAALKAHPAIAPLVEGGEVKEYSAHLIPEAGLAMMPKMTGDGMLVAGDAAALCLAAGIWLEGVNFAMASGIAAGEAAGRGARRRRHVTRRARRLRAPAGGHVRAPRPPQAAPGARAGAVGPRPAPLPAARRRRRRGDVPGRQPAPQAGAAHASSTQERKRLGIRRRDLAPRRPRPDGGRSGDDVSEWPEVGFEDLIGTTRFDVHEQAHIVVDGAVCADCSTRECVVACPAKLFVPTADGGILFNYEQCFECGTCYLVCNREGAISWSYPEGGHGVVFRRS